MKILPPSTWALHNMIYAQAPLVLWPRDGWLSLVTEMAWPALHIYQSLCPLGSWTLSKRTEGKKHIFILKTNKPKHKKVNFQFSFICIIVELEYLASMETGIDWDFLLRTWYLSQLSWKVFLVCMRVCDVCLCFGVFWCFCFQCIHCLTIWQTRVYEA